MITNQGKVNCNLFTKYQVFKMHIKLYIKLSCKRSKRKQTKIKLEPRQVSQQVRRSSRITLYQPSRLQRPRVRNTAQALSAK